jgi:AhpD family alkylhydroperoxidase
MLRILDAAEAMSNPFPAGRIQLSVVATKQMAAMFRLERSIELDDRLGNLIRVRASQINGCAFCIDMHWKDARAAGESEERLYSLEAWRESPCTRSGSGRRWSCARR